MVQKQTSFCYISQSLNRRDKRNRQKQTDKATNEKLKGNKQNIKENQTKSIQHNINQPKSKQKQKKQQIAEYKNPATHFHWRSHYWSPRPLLSTCRTSGREKHICSQQWNQNKETSKIILHQQSFSQGPWLVTNKHQWQNMTMGTCWEMCRERSEEQHNLHLIWQCFPETLVRYCITIFTIQTMISRATSILVLVIWLWETIV